MTLTEQDLEALRSVMKAAMLAIDDASPEIEDIQIAGRMYDARKRLMWKLVDLRSMQEYEQRKD